jgi:PAS domain-containing protein
MINLSIGKFFERSRAAAPWDIDTLPVRIPDGSMQATRRELALFASEMMGVQLQVGQFGQSRATGDPAFERRSFRDLIEQSELPYMVIDPRPGLHIVDINDAYARATLTDRDCVAGGRLFDTFPDNPADPAADGVSNLFESLQRAAQTGAPHAMADQRYDVRDANGSFVTRYWRPLNTPVLDEAGQLVYLLHHVADVTAQHADAVVDSRKVQLSRGTG